ncbi:hypothetical protein AAMO2058_000376800 [Amorphochlora amoebiformis]|mmetsp:Transcript_7389/g.11449  ORF Transcript_7389/g.11449 Transcript_7389/m.11449 type:complete len:128 (-) Transcript_7389:144-527(-)|eukprot:188937-Amorphochlora_amoeboformis.AAC.2
MINPFAVLAALVIILGISTLVIACFWRSALPDEDDLLLIDLENIEQSTVVQVANGYTPSGSHRAENNSYCNAPQDMQVRGIRIRIETLPVSASACTGRKTPQSCRLLSTAYKGLKLAPAKIALSCHL